MRLLSFQLLGMTAKKYVHTSSFNAYASKGRFVISLRMVQLLQANLIMRVLKLTDEEMALLPAEHRQSILALKDQIAKSAGKR